MNSSNNGPNQGQGGAGNGQPTQHFFLFSPRHNSAGTSGSGVINHFHGTGVLNNYNFVHPGQYNVTFSGNPVLQGRDSGLFNNFPSNQREGIQVTGPINLGQNGATNPMNASPFPIHGVGNSTVDRFSPHPQASRGASLASGSAAFQPRSGLAHFHLASDGTFTPLGAPAPGVGGKSPQPPAQD